MLENKETTCNKNARNVGKYLGDRRLMLCIAVKNQRTKPKIKVQKKTDCVVAGANDEFQR